VSVPFVLGKDARLPWVGLGRQPQRAGQALEHRLGDVVAVAAVVEHHVDIRARRGGEALPEHLDQLGVEGADRGHREVDREHAGRATAQVDGRRHERLVHRQHGVAVAADAPPVAEGLGHRHAERAADVLDGVVTVDVRVASAADLQIEQRVARQQREHVVEEADPSGDLGTAGAVEVERKPNVGLLGGAADGGGAGHGGGLQDDGGRA